MNTVTVNGKTYAATPLTPDQKTIFGMVCHEIARKLRWSEVLEEIKSLPAVAQAAAVSTFIQTAEYMNPTPLKLRAARETPSGVATLLFLVTGENLTVLADDRYDILRQLLPFLEDEPPQFHGRNRISESLN